MLFVGGMIPVVFSAMNSVGKAMDMVYEVRRQFREILELWRNWKTRICKMCRHFYQSGFEMMLPGILTIGFPIAIVLLGS
jgi:K(+)-stimulated pyrophosphate-energized sodium pump